MLNLERAASTYLDEGRVQYVGNDEVSLPFISFMLRTMLSISHCCALRKIGKGAYLPFFCCVHVTKGFLKNRCNMSAIKNDHD